MRYGIFLSLGLFSSFITGSCFAGGYDQNCPNVYKYLELIEADRLSGEFPKLFSRLHRQPNTNAWDIATKSLIENSDLTRVAANSHGSFAIRCGNELFQISILKDSEGKADIVSATRIDLAKPYFRF